MIYLRSVSKTYISEDAPPKPVLFPSTIALPTDRRVAILGPRSHGKTTLLRLLAGAEAPDKGEVIAPPGLSPIANARTLFQPRLTAVENVRLVARLLGLDTNQLTLTVSACCGMGKDIERPIYALSGPQRQVLEIALLSILSFGCYFLDNAHSMPPTLLERYFDAAERRGAGVIFASAVSRQAQAYADYAVVIRGCTVRAFNQVEEAIESYDRKAV